MLDDETLNKLNAELLALPEHERGEAMGKLLKNICRQCGSVVADGQPCWGCYVSPAIED